MLSNREILQRFVVIEGIDGAGTTTQLNLLGTRFTQHGCAHVATAEPTDSPIGQLIRRYLGGDLHCHPGTLARLFAADRFNHLFDPENGIKRHLDDGAWVLNDRYIFSSLAYQGTLWDYERVHELNREFPLPEYLFFINTPSEIGSKRRNSRSHKEIYEQDSIQSKVYDGYLRILEEYKNTGMHIHVIDGALSENEIHEILWQVLKTSDTV